MLEVLSQVDVDAPASEVFEFIADASNNPIWQRGMKSCVWITPGPIAEASRYRQEASFLGRRIVSTFIVTEFEPGHSITIETIESTFPIKVTRSVEPLRDRLCRVTAHVTGEPGGLLRFLGPLTRRMVTRSVAQDYRQLARNFAAN